jgi:hypothetical protein
MGGAEGPGLSAGVYSSSVRWLPHSVAGPCWPSARSSDMARCVMKWLGTAPCQYHSAGGVVAGRIGIRSVDGWMLQSMNSAIYAGQHLGVADLQVPAAAVEVVLPSPGEKATRVCGAPLPPGGAGGVVVSGMAGGVLGAEQAAVPIQLLAPSRRPSLQKRAFGDGLVMGCVLS